MSVMYNHNTVEANQLGDLTDKNSGDTFGMTVMSFVFFIALGTGIPLLFGARGPVLFIALALSAVIPFLGTLSMLEDKNKFHRLNEPKIKQLLQRGVVTQAKILDFGERENYSLEHPPEVSKTYSLIYEYEVAWLESSAQTFVQSISNSNGPFPGVVGDLIEVCYLPEAPHICLTEFHFEKFRHLGETYDERKKFDKVLVSNPCRH